jgi:hypothetical protein
MEVDEDPTLVAMRETLKKPAWKSISPGCARQYDTRMTRVAME